MSKTVATATVSTQCGFANARAELLVEARRANVLVQFCEIASGTVGESTVCEVASATVSTQRGLWKSQHSQRFFFQPHGNPDLPQDRFSICMDG